MLKHWEQELSNWGRWGDDDQRGLLNLITPEKTKQATTLVREGTTVTLQINPFKKSGSDTGSFGENVHRMARIDPVTGEPLGALDVIQLSIHDGLNSHLDALCHYQGPIGRDTRRARRQLQRVPLHPDRRRLSRVSGGPDGPRLCHPWHPGRPAAAPGGSMAGAEHADLRGGSRGVGEPSRASPSAPVMRCSSAPVDGRSETAEGPWAYGRGGAGLHASVLPWLRERDVSLLASDAVNDVQPSGVDGINRPIHQVTQVNLGLPLVDNAYLEDAALEAQRLMRWEFMFTLHIYQIPGWHRVALQRPGDLLTPAGHRSSAVIDSTRMVFVSASRVPVTRTRWPAQRLRLILVAESIHLAAVGQHVGVAVREDAGLRNTRHRSNPSASGNGPRSCTCCR